MAYIRVDVSYTIKDGSEVVFVAPCNCNEIYGLKVYDPDGSKIFTFKDAHGNSLIGLGNLFSKDAYVKAILDVKNNYAYIQNADTNLYLEDQLQHIEARLGNSIHTCAATNGALSVTMPFENIYISADGSLKKGDVLVSEDLYMYKIISFDTDMENAELSYLGNLNGGSFTEEDKQEIVDEVLASMVAAEEVSF